MKQRGFKCKVTTSHLQTKHLYLFYNDITTDSKGFDGSAAIGEWVDIDKFRDIQMVNFHLDINGKTVQEGCSCDMLFKVDELVEYISRWFTLKTGDLIYTGTPVGVGAVHIDDHLSGWIEDRKVLEFNVK